MNRYFLILVVWISVSCEKDPVIVEDVEPYNIAEYLSRVNPDKISNTLWAHAGNHPAFEPVTDQQAIHIRMHLPQDFQNVQLYVNDSVEHRDRMELYLLQDKDVHYTDGQIFGRFAIKKTQDNRSRMAIVSLETIDSVYYSAPLLLRGNNTATDTKNVSKISIETTPGGRAYINWSGAGLDEPWRNLVELTDQTGEVFCAVETDDLSFLFHDLRNVTQNFTPSLRDPRLIDRQIYSVAIYRNDNQGWMRNYRIVEFEADSARIQRFD